MKNVGSAVAQAGRNLLKGVRAKDLLISFDKSRAEWEALIQQWIFSKRDREMLIDHLLDGMPFEELAEKHKMSVTQAKTVMRKAEQELFRHA